MSYDWWKIRSVDAINCNKHFKHWLFLFNPYLTYLLQRHIWRGQRVELPPWQAKCKNWTYNSILIFFWFSVGCRIFSFEISGFKEYRSTSVLTIISQVFFLSVYWLRKLLGKQLTWFFFFPVLNPRRLVISSSERILVRSDGIRYE